MKYSIIVSSILVVCLGFYYVQLPVETKKKADNTEKMIEIIDVTEGTSSKFPEVTVDLSVDVVPTLTQTDESANIEEIKVRVEQKRKELELMMNEFEENISDSDTRKLLKAKIDLTLQEYNKLILPLALDKMQ